MRVRVQVPHPVDLDPGPRSGRRGDTGSAGGRTRTRRTRPPKRAAGTRRRSSQAMDAEGLDVAVLFPSRGLFVLGLDTREQAGTDGYEPEFAAAIARGVQRLAARLLPAGPRPAVRRRAARAARRRRRGRRDRARVERLRLQDRLPAPGVREPPAVARPALRPDLGGVRARSTCRSASTAAVRTTCVPTTRSRCSTTLMMWHTFDQPLGVMAVAVSLTGGGVLERFPNLRVGLLEGNCGWAPWLFHRLDEHWEWVGDEPTRPTLEQRPSEYFRSNCFVSVEADETPVKYYVDWFGDDNLVFSTDYPHGDSKYPHSVSGFLELPLSGRVRSARSSGTTGAGSTTCRSIASSSRSRSVPVNRLSRPGRVMPLDPRLRPIIDMMNAHPPTDDTGMSVADLRARGPRGDGVVVPRDERPRARRVVDRRPPDRGGGRRDHGARVHTVGRGSVPRPSLPARRRLLARRTDAIRPQLPGDRGRRGVRRRLGRLPTGTGAQVPDGAARTATPRSSGSSRAPTSWASTRPGCPSVAAAQAAT